MFEWNVDQVEELKRLWAEGLPAAEIGRRMGGLSRNAIIGKVSRLDLPRRREAGKPRKIVSVPLIPLEGGVSFNDLKSHHCREIIGWDKAAMGLARYCGAPKVGGDSSYCRKHHQKNHIPVRVR